MPCATTRIVSHSLTVATSLTDSSPKKSCVTTRITCAEEITEIISWCYDDELIGKYKDFQCNKNWAIVTPVVWDSFWNCYVYLTGGIIQHHCTDTDINHAVQITGYDFNGKIPIITRPFPIYLGRFPFTKKFGKFLLGISVWEECVPFVTKFHYRKLREAWPLKKPRKVWNWW